MNISETDGTKVVTGQRPRVNEAREFIEIAKDFKRPQELLREALSNAWDAHATTVSILVEPGKVNTMSKGRKKQILNITIQDDGDGMDVNEIGYFFNLGDSHKPAGSIGTKGHGTKIFYKSEGIRVTMHKNGQTIVAETEVPPWETLNHGIIPTYKYEVSPNTSGARGTIVKVVGFDSRHSEFDDLKAIAQYLKWNTIGGSLQRAIRGAARSMQTNLRLPGMPAQVTLNNDFELPIEQPDIKLGTSSVVRMFPIAKDVDAGATSDGRSVSVDVLVILLGDQARDFIPDSLRDTGVWLCKDYIMVERNTKLLEDVTGGQYYYRSFLAFANCQQFDLTANRNNVRQDEAYDLAMQAVEDQLTKVWDDEYVQTFFKTKSAEESSSKKARAVADMDKRLQAYDKRPRLDAGVQVRGIPRRIPQNEAETLLVLQSIISSGFKGIDFTIGEYSAQSGTDAIIEYEDKGVPRTGWLELVFELSRLFDWDHHLERIHKIVCWELGKMKDKYTLPDGTEVRYEKSGKKHVIYHDASAVPVYVLSELLKLPED
jgi:hypothetical protein